MSSRLLLIQSLTRSNIIKKQPITYITDIEENERRQKLYEHERKVIADEKDDRGLGLDELRDKLDRERNERSRLEMNVHDLKEDLTKANEKISFLEEQLKDRGSASTAQSTARTDSRRERELEEAIRKLKEELARERKEKEKEKDMRVQLMKQLESNQRENTALRRQIDDVQRDMERMREELQSNADNGEDESEEGIASLPQEPVVKGNLDLLRSLQGSKSGNNR